jgi:RNA recognition motif. (a.k.a. RRM, RBD, or RNP domain)
MSNNLMNNPSSLGSKNMEESTTNRGTTPRPGNGLYINSSEGYSSGDNNMRNSGTNALQHTRNRLNINGGINLFGNIANDAGIGDLYSHLHGTNGTDGIIHQSGSQSDELSNSPTPEAKWRPKNIESGMSILSMDKDPCNDPDCSDQHPVYETVQETKSTQLKAGSNQGFSKVPASEIAKDSTSSSLEYQTKHQSANENMSSFRISGESSRMSSTINNAYTMDGGFEPFPNNTVRNGHRSDPRKPYIKSPRKDPSMCQDKNGRWFDQDGDGIVPNAIVIKGIPWKLHIESLKAVMRKTGMTMPHSMNYHFEDKIFNGLAFANFHEQHEAWAAIQTLHGMRVEGRNIEVQSKKVQDPAQKEETERRKRNLRGQTWEQHQPYPDGVKIPVPEFTPASQLFKVPEYNSPQIPPLSNNEYLSRQSQTFADGGLSASKLYLPLRPLSGSHSSRMLKNMG